MLQISNKSLIEEYFQVFFYLDRISQLGRLTYIKANWLRFVIYFIVLK